MRLTRPAIGPGAGLLASPAMRLRHLLVGLGLAALSPAAALSAWSPAVTVSPPGASLLGSPDAAVTSGGEALVAWIRRPEADATTGRVQVAWRHGPRRRWVTGRLLSRGGASAPRVALNARGDAVVSWVSGRTVVAAVRRGRKGRWAAARVVQAPVGVQEVRPAMGARGRPIVMWSERRGDGFLVRLATRVSARAGWSVRPARVGTPGPAPPALALSPGAGAMAAWIADGHLWTARTAKGTFEAPREVSSEDSSTPAVALSPGGAGLAAWGVGLPGGSSVVLGAGRARAGLTWGSEKDLGIGRTPRAALNDRGDAVVAWGLAGPGEPQGIEATTRRRGGPWRASTVVSRRTCGCSLTVGRVAMDGSGAAVVAWRRDEGAGVGGGGAASSQAGGSQWARAAVAPGRIREAPAVSAADGEGAVAVWAEEAPGRGVRAALLAG